MQSTFYNYGVFGIQVKIVSVILSGIMRQPPPIPKFRTIGPRFGRLSRMEFVKFSKTRHIRSLLRPKHGPGREDFGCQGVGSRQENREKKSNRKLVQFPHYPVIFHTPIA